MPVTLKAEPQAMPGLVQPGAYTLSFEAVPTSTPGTRSQFGQHARNAYTMGGHPLH